MMTVHAGDINVTLPKSNLTVWDNIVIAIPLLFSLITIILIIYILVLTIISWFSSHAYRYNRRLFIGFILVDCALLTIIAARLPIEYLIQHNIIDVCRGLFFCSYGMLYSAAIGVALLAYFFFSLIGTIGTCIIFFRSKSDKVNDIFYKHLLLKWFIGLFLSIVFWIYLIAFRY